MPKIKPKGMGNTTIMKIMANVWGKQIEVNLTSWAEIRKLGFRPQDRSFGNLNDGTPALYFNGGLMFPMENGFLPNGGKDEWFLTTETLDEITKFEKLVELEINIHSLFKEMDVHYETFITDEDTIGISIEWGDWKHDHLYLKYKMEQKGFVQIDEILTEENGSDCYSALHIYRKNKK